MARIGRRINKSDSRVIDLFNKYKESEIEYVDIDTIAYKEGVSVIYSDNLNPEISGSLNKVNDEWIIIVNNKHAIHRKRFAIAHELAHYILHKNISNSFEDIAFFKSENLSDSIEMQANNFAAEILISEKLVRCKISEGITAVSKLSEIFGVSPLAMKFRLKSLGYKLAIINEYD